MKPVLIHPCYFGPIDLYAHIAQSDEFAMEKHDNYQKQTYRTRQYIYGANGKLLLNVPIKHRENKTDEHQKYKDIQIENAFKWQRLHWKSIEAAYRSSPYFEFYEDEFVDLFEKKATFLMDFNLKCMQTVFDCLNLDFHFKFTEAFEMSAETYENQRNLVNSKRKQKADLEEFIQVFQPKYGYISNLSILDLLFNKGPSALDYLESQKLSR
ncbi:WbqC family protein [Psychroflexus sediminis]|uniref:WbqC-like protein family protein n=1 Tax=Psychroflexus sediminis TaxID=470826 RepID=A0A1G7XIE1_9FLAO|nr:WbqC family protein [Psychroflexus sediminis]SDG83400.1 WbqC-like protein family protein [Psychroflexus sediminis]